MKCNDLKDKYMKNYDLFFISSNIVVGYNQMCFAFKDFLPNPDQQLMRYRGGGDLHHKFFLSISENHDFL